MLRDCALRLQAQASGICGEGARPFSGPGSRRLPMPPRPSTARGEGSKRDVAREVGGVLKGLDRGGRGGRSNRQHRLQIKSGTWVTPADVGWIENRGGARLTAAQPALRYRFIESKNSSLVLVSFILSRRNSMAASSSIGCSSLRRIQTFCRSAGFISSSSRRVPERLILMAG